MNDRKNRHILETAVAGSAKAYGIRNVVATVSGGADSVALVSALSACKGITLTALHCNFHLRGEESMRDQYSVEELCRQLEVKLHVKDFNVVEYMESHPSTSVEMACRNLRYEWFREIKSHNGADRIATGHNAGDNIETLFLNLLRGCGTSGLRGMPEDNGEIWRPLIKFQRSEITGYLKEKGLGFIVDSSNLSSDYRRNFIRNEILPLLRQKWEGADKALLRSQNILRNENRIVETSVASCLPAGNDPLLSETVLSFPDPELLVRRYIEPLSPFTTTAAEIMSSIKADKPDIKRWKLRKGELMMRNRRLFRIFNQECISKNN